MATDYRARKAGSQLKLQKEQEKRYDAEDYLGTPDRVVDWIDVALEGEIPNLDIPPTHGKSVGWKKIQFWLRDGVVLCKLINKLLKSVGKPPVKYNTNANTAFVALENIEHFNQGCQEYGLAEIDCFQSIDLYEGSKGPFLNVINCLNKLGFEANEKGFEPSYLAVEPPTKDRRWSQF